MSTRLERTLNHLEDLNLQLTKISDIETSLHAQLSLVHAAQSKITTETEAIKQKVLSLGPKITQMHTVVSTHPFPNVMKLLEDSLSAVLQQVLSRQSHCVSVFESIRKRNESVNDEKRRVKMLCQAAQPFVQSLAGVTGPLAWTQNNPGSLAHVLEGISNQTEDSLVESVSHIGQASVDHYNLTRRLQDANLTLAHLVKDLVQKKEQDLLDLVNAFEFEKDRLQRIYGAALSMNAEQSFHMNRGTHAPVPCGGSDKERILRQRRSEDDHEVRKLKSEFEILQAERAELLIMVNESEQQHKVNLEKIYAQRAKKEELVQAERRLQSKLKVQKEELKVILLDLEEAVEHACRA